MVVFFFYRWFYHNGRMCFDPFSPVGFQRKFFQRPVQAPNFLLIFYLFIPILPAFLFLLFWWVKIGKDLNVSRCFFKKKDFFSTSTFFSAFFTSSVQTPPFFFFLTGFLTLPKKKENKRQKGLSDEKRAKLGCFV